MRDPHVTRLHYTISTGANIEFGAPPHYVLDNHLGRFDLDLLKLVVLPSAHFPSAAAARSAIDPFLRAWEVESDLTRNIGSVRFAFSTADVVDRDPPPITAGVTIEVGVADLLVAGETATVVITQGSYPPAPSTFLVTPEVEIAYARWLAFRAQREPLQSMAYSILTLLQSMAGGRREAASVFCVDEEVLREVGRLSSTKGDGATARKLCLVVSLQPLSGGESGWLEATVRRLIRRLGEHAADASLSRISMSELSGLQ